MTNHLRAIKGSVTAFGVVLVAGLVSMGFPGIGLYYLVAPVLRRLSPLMAEWHGDWVWSAVILAGMGWSFGFLLTGDLNRLLGSRFRWSSVPRMAIYLGVLWAWDLAVWLFIPAFPPK